ncbi:hypothetical protein G3M48_006563 [Beauveria asiatica]|uniref:Trafficking protein particle complex subunit 12 n=1 Tax=Beauveria asiatica TaxID=1069075 RepID=A0AAW0RPF8_9HYPO
MAASRLTRPSQTTIELSCRQAKVLAVVLEEPAEEVADLAKLRSRQGASKGSHWSYSCPEFKLQLTKPSLFLICEDNQITMSQPTKSSAKVHTRNKSSTSRTSRPRASTKGPLDADDDPLTNPGTPAAQTSPNSSIRRSIASPRGRQTVSSPVSQIGESHRKDFSFLLRPEIYHPLTPLNVPLAFRSSSRQPDPSGRPEELLARGHFRAAAIAAVQELTGSGSRPGVDPHDAPRIFDLLYTRLACLTLIDATSLAAQEVKALEDLTSTRTYVDETTGAHLVPWPLRVLNVRLQALGFGDPRRAVMSYHDLAREAREHIAKAAARYENSESELWKERLQELGIKVAGALIDMDDLPGAAHQLRSLRSRGDARLELCRALLWLQLGDAESARACARQCADNAETTEGIILALCDMAEANYEGALARWHALRAALDDEMVSVNTAICLLYLGRIVEGRDILEGLVDKGFSSRTLLFNLSTMYELCTEKNKALKTRLTERVAAMKESAVGWERVNADFKL